MILAGDSAKLRKEIAKYDNFLGETDFVDIVTGIRKFSASLN